ncbi:hypothetical protein V3C99_000913 [Haemonchus contortus]
MKTKEEFDDWLAERGLLWKDRPCLNCGNPRKVTKQYSDSGEDGRWKFECNRRACRQPGVDRKVGYLRTHSLSFAYDLGATKEMARTLEVDEQTVQQWTQWFRDVLVEHYTNNVVQIGGPNTIVQIGETNVVRRKYNVVRVVRKDWLVGGI